MNIPRLIGSRPRCYSIAAQIALTCSFADLQAIIGICGVSRWFDDQRASVPLMGIAGPLQLIPLSLIILSV